jgi:hypothetical protein
LRTRSPSQGCSLSAYTIAPRQQVSAVVPSRQHRDSVATGLSHASKPGSLAVRTWLCLTSTKFAMFSIGSVTAPATVQQDESLRYSKKGSHQYQPSPWRWSVHLGSVPISRRLPPHGTCIQLPIECLPMSSLTLGRPRKRYGQATNALGVSTAEWSRCQQLTVMHGHVKRPARHVLGRFKVSHRRTCSSRLRSDSVNGVSVPQLYAPSLI